MSRCSGCFRPRQDSKAKWHLGCSVVKVWPGVIERPPELQWRCSEVPVSCTKFAVPLLMDITFFRYFEILRFLQRLALMITQGKLIGQPKKVLFSYDEKFYIIFKKDSIFIKYFLFLLFLVRKEEFPWIPNTFFTSIDYLINCT